ncbi:MAG TPA: hypothetical protein VH880_04220 [Anaeromyxobacteraceae bacterium]|jgi:hypothetical protein
MRRPHVLLALGLAAAAHPARAEPYRDQLGVPSYRLLASMLAQFRDRAPLDRASKAVEIIAPLARALDQKHGADVERRLRRAIRADDRDGAFAATAALVLLDAEDLVDGIRRDDYTGWADARVRTKKAFLDYGLVAEDVRRRLADMDRRLVMSFGRLALALHDSDMTSPPGPIDAARSALAADLAATRSALDGARTRSGSGEGGG